MRKSATLRMEISIIQKNETIKKITKNFVSFLVKLNALRKDKISWLHPHINWKIRKKIYLPPLPDTSPLIITSVTLDVVSVMLDVVSVMLDAMSVMLDAMSVMLETADSTALSCEYTGATLFINKDKQNAVPNIRLNPIFLFLFIKNLNDNPI